MNPVELGVETDGSLSGFPSWSSLASALKTARQPEVVTVKGEMATFIASLIGPSRVSGTSKTP